jgi:murein DD-endopeptidase MepM/ murein hydrolase activator NlpD
VTPNLQAIAAIWSFKRELKLVLFTFLITLLIPVLAVILVANVGLSVVSDKLVTLNPQTNTIEIHDPRTGKVIKDLKITAVWPVSGVVTLEFGESDFPYQIYHTGIDIANPQHQIGDPITPFMEGTVIFAGESPIGLGKHVIIDHGDNITSFYGHMSAVYAIKGQKVKPGDVIGLEGESGWSTGPHVHFQIDVFGIPVNPRVFLQGNP